MSQRIRGRAVEIKLSVDGQQALDKLAKEFGVGVPPVTEFDRDAALIKLCASEQGDSFIVTPAYPLLWCVSCRLAIRQGQKAVIVSTPISHDSFQHETPNVCAEMVERASRPRRGGS